jgi:hypothetical protein
MFSIMILLIGQMELACLHLHLTLLLAAHTHATVWATHPQKCIYKYTKMSKIHKNKRKCLTNSLWARGARVNLPKVILAFSILRTNSFYMRL